MAKAAERFGRGDEVEEFKPSGAAEIRQAGYEFDKMRKRIVRHLKQRSEMLSGISHDLRTPLTRMKLQTAFIKDKDLAKKLTEDINIVSISSFEDLIKLSSEKKEVELKYDLKKNVNLIKFSEGKIDISLNENLGKNFVRNLSEKLLEWTGKRWVITLSKEVGQNTFSERQSINSVQMLEQEKKKEVYKKFKSIFSDGELVKVSKED